MKSLKTLSLEYNQLTKLPESIGDLENLENLYLSGNQITELPTSIFKLENLTNLHLMNNPLKASEKQKIKKAFKYTNVYF
jgi:Leucine-rich repeat (LRR) protein